MSTREERYDDWLDDLDPLWLVESYGVSRILSKVDPIAYRCMFADWEDTNACQTEDCDGDPNEEYDGYCDECADGIAEDAEREEIESVQGYCTYVLDGIDTDGSKWYRCILHDALTLGPDFQCEDAPPPEPYEEKEAQK